MLPSVTPLALACSLGMARDRTLSARGSIGQPSPAVWNPHVGGGTPRNFGPCGDVLDQNRTLLFRRFERRYPYLLPVMPAAEECLLVPFYVAGKQSERSGRSCTVIAAGSMQKMTGS